MYNNFFGVGNPLPWRGMNAFDQPVANDNAMTMLTLLANLQERVEVLEKLNNIKNNNNWLDNGERPLAINLDDVNPLQTMTELDKKLKELEK